VSRDCGGYAFASEEKYQDGTARIYEHHHGMTLRDYFAAKAMQAAATNPTGADGFTFSQRAAWAYQQADAMLAERAK
jgi:hypothetical protein